MSIQDQVIVASKSIFASKTFWANILGPVFVWLATNYGLNLDPVTQGEAITVVMALANIALRKLAVQPVHVITPQLVAVPGSKNG